MELVAKQQFKNKKRDIRITSIYSRSLITRNIILPMTAIGKNIKDTLEINISANFEGKCLVEGFIKPGSSKIITYSSGVIYRGSNILFEVIFACLLVFGSLVFVFSIFVNICCSLLIFA